MDFRGSLVWDKLLWSEMQVKAFNSLVIVVTARANFIAISLLQKGIIQIYIHHHNAVTNK